MAWPNLRREILRGMLAAWAVAFPTITFLLLVLEPVMEGWPLIARTLIVVTLMVPIVSVTTPKLARWILAWTSPSTSN